MILPKVAFVFLCFTTVLSAQEQTIGNQVEQEGRRGNPAARRRGIEPGAGTWRTWIISSGRDYRVPPPPGPGETRAELKSLTDLVLKNDSQIQQQIAFWDAGSPAYRWMDMINARALSGAPLTTYAHRVYAYVAMAMYDATIATWESK